MGRKKQVVLVGNCMSNNEDGEILSQAEEDFNKLKAEVRDIYSNANWDDVRVRLYRMTGALKLNIVMGILFSLVFFIFDDIARNGVGVIEIMGTPRALIRTWMMVSGFTCVFGLAGWMRVLLDDAWERSMVGDVIDGVVVDVLTVTFVTDYVEVLKKSLRPFVIVNVGCYGLLIAILSLTHNKELLSNETVFNLWMLCMLVAVAAVLTVMSIKYGIRLCRADKVVVSQLAEDFQVLR